MIAWGPWRAAALACLIATPLAAQVDPANDWRTITTPNFRVHFIPGLETLARRAAGEAERAWMRLAVELSPPRGPVDLVVADNRDLSNGQAGYFPTNRITIWVRPPIDSPALRFSDDWLQQVVTHELAHVFHLDRSRGLWRVGQAIFGRHPALFPNARAPRWLTEGIAIAYESRLSGGGRLNGTELPARMDAWNASHGVAAPGRLSLATPWWPGGNLAYFGGARIVAEAEERGGEGALRRFIDRVAVFPIPYLWDVQARHAFGESFGALARAVDSAVTVVRDTARLAGPYWDLQSLRWSGDSVLFVADGPRDLTGLYRAHDGDVRRLARRNNPDAFGAAGPWLVHAELEYADEYRLFSYLYINGRRVPRAGRVTSPDVRADGMIVAVATEAGVAHLVLIDSTGQRVRELTPPDPDVHWSEPRWSRSGTAIAAIRWQRGGDSEVGVLDVTGTVQRTLARARAVQRSPGWDAGDVAIYFVSDRGGRSEGYRVALDGPDSGVVQRVTPSGAVLDAIEVSPDGRTLAAARVTPDGYDLIALAATASSRARVAAGSALKPGLDDPVVTAGGPVRTYSPWRTLLPRYWIPTAGTSARDEYALGFYTSGTDVIGRHSVSAEGLWDVESREFSGTGRWTYRGLRVPTIDAAVHQSWSVFPIVDSARARLGEVTRRNRVASVTASWSRPRVRTGFQLVAGAEYEWRHFNTHPDSLAPLLDPAPPDRLRYPAVVVGAAWSATRRASLALGPEDGVALSITGRRRWRTDDPAATTAHSVIARARAFVSLPFPGHARHVLAVSGSHGWAQPLVSSAFAAGGNSGTTLEVLPGYRIGDAQRSFFVRGFAPGALNGTRAWATSAEYRAPLVRIGTGAWPLPFYFQRTSLAVFADAASAWCPAAEEPSGACPSGRTPATTLASVGAELQLDATVEYDSPTRFRLGIAVPVNGRDAVGAPRSRVYASLGVPF